MMVVYIHSAAFVNGYEITHQRNIKAWLSVNAVTWDVLVNGKTVLSILC